MREGGCAHTINIYLTQGPAPGIVSQGQDRFRGYSSKIKTELNYLFFKTSHITKKFNGSKVEFFGNPLGTL